LDIFEYITAALMLILGLGVTQLLGDVVSAFRRRQTSRLHWIPMTWAAIVFAWQMQFLWAVFELQGLQDSWSAVEFLVLLTLALLLFAAGSLVVPRADDETRKALTQFQQDGRWTLVILAAFFALAYYTNVRYFGSDYRDPWSIDDLLLATVLLVTVCARKERTWAAATIVFAIASAISIVGLSPGQYR
jgi:hypothetical protein